MTILKKRTMTRISSVSYDTGKYCSFHFHATTGSLSAAMASGHFNDMRDELQVGDHIFVAAGMGGSMESDILRVTAVPEAPGNITTEVAIDYPDAS